MTENEKNAEIQRMRAEDMRRDFNMVDITIALEIAAIVTEFNGGAKSDYL